MDSAVAPVRVEVAFDRDVFFRAIAVVMLVGVEILLSQAWIRD
jgi:hypothetical protein